MMSNNRSTQYGNMKSGSSKSQQGNKQKSERDQHLNKQDQQ